MNRLIRRTTIILIAALAALGVSACTDEQVAICQATPGCIEAWTATHHDREAQAAEAAATAPQDCYQAIERYWPADSQGWARAIVKRESNNTPTAQNRTSSAAGCFQLLSMHAHRFNRVGYTWGDRYNPTANTLAALDLYREAGRSPWAT